MKPDQIAMTLTDEQKILALEAFDRRTNWNLARPDFKAQVYAVYAAALNATEGRVPREPTRAMKEAARARWMESQPQNGWEMYDAIWQAMYDAAIRGDEGRGM